MSASAFVEKIVEVNGEKKKILTLKRKINEDVTCETEENKDRIQPKMPRDVLNDQETCFELQVNKSRLKCSRKVIESSQLWQDIVDFTDPEDDSPILVPAFITKQMILDLVEMVEKDDMDCAHLVLVSLSYLLDFLVAVDFLCCDKLKAGVEKKIRTQISKDNWREVLTFTRDIMGLDNTTRAALEPIIKSVDYYYQIENKFDLDKEHEDPWSSDYCGLSVPVFKLVLRSKSPLINEETKVHMLRSWVASNSFLKHQTAVFEMLQCLDFKEFLGPRKKIPEVTAMVKSWPLTEEQTSTFNSMVSKARREKEASEEKRKRMKFGDCERGEGLLFHRHQQRHGRSWGSLRIQFDQQGPGGSGGSGVRMSRRLEAAPQVAAQPQDSDDEEMERIIEMERILYAAGEGRMVEVARQALGMNPAPQPELEHNLGPENGEEGAAGPS